MLSANVKFSMKRTFLTSTNSWTIFRRKKRNEYDRTRQERVVSLDPSLQLVSQLRKILRMLQGIYRILVQRTQGFCQPHRLLYRRVYRFTVFKQNKNQATSLLRLRKMRSLYISVQFLCFPLFFLHGSLIDYINVSFIYF